MEEHCFDIGGGSSSKECTMKVEVNARFRHQLFFPFSDYFLFITLLLCLHFIQPTDFLFSCHFSVDVSAKFRGSTLSSALVKS